MKYAILITCLSIIGTAHAADPKQAQQNGLADEYQYGKAEKEKPQPQPIEENLQY